MSSNLSGFTKKDSSCLKGVAIMMMLYHHLYCSAGRFEDYEVSFWPFSYDFATGLSLALKICVSFFVFVTGYGLYKSIKNISMNRNEVSKWTLSRTLKTMSGFYFVFILSSFVAQIIDSKFTETFFSEDTSVPKGIIYVLSDFLGFSNLLGTPSLNGTWWYMAAAVIFIILIPIIFIIGEKIGYISIFALFCLIPYLFNVDYPGATNPLLFFPILVLGMFFAKYNIFEKIEKGLNKINKFAAYILCFIVFGLATVFLAYIAITTSYEKMWILQLNIAPVVYILFLRFCVIRIPVIKQILDFLGKRSMSIFLTHTFI
ncbi:MAG: acyltransferase, partial [Clostridiales bacterium]|nr:acyltransferase [Clostridiales bacterium]